LYRRWLSDGRTGLGVCRYFSGEDIDFVDLGRFGEELVGLGHEGGGDLAVEVSVAAFVRRKGVENAEGVFVKFYRVPGDGKRSVVSSQQSMVSSQ
jgi:hypothetical protein